MFRGSRTNDTPRETPLRPKRRPPRPQHPDFQRFSPRWSALWAPHHLKPRSHRHQTGEMTSLESRHADSQPLMLQNPHRHRRGGRRRNRRARAAAPVGGGAWPGFETAHRSKLAARTARGPPTAQLGPTAGPGTQIIACQFFCVWGLEVGGDWVGVGGGELGEGLFPVGGGVSLGEACGGCSFVGGFACVCEALGGSFVFDVADSQP